MKNLGTIDHMQEAKYWDISAWGGNLSQLMLYMCGNNVTKRGSTMATDYDAPRKSDEEISEDSIEELKTRRNDKNSGSVDEDEAEAAESFELPGADLSNEELTVRVVPRQTDEFSCAGCFLVKNRSQIAETRRGKEYCVDCV